MTTDVIDAAQAGTWTLGDAVVRRVGFGAMRLPQTGPALIADAVPRDRAAIAVLRRAVELGVDHIDTAAFYFSSRLSANELINSALSAHRDELFIATKVGPARDTAGEWAAHAMTPESLRGQVEENLRQLGTDRLDLVNLRIVRDDHFAERFGALAEMRDAGLIRHLGLSNVQPRHLEIARAIAPVVCVQNPFGLGAFGEQREMLELCGELGVAFVPFYSLAGTNRERGASQQAGDAPEVLEVARAHGATPAQIRIAWTLHQGPHVLVIPGTGDLRHLAENVAAGGIRLSEDDLQLLDTAQAAG
ncbi:aldo/keto reductase [Actinomadura logoneensis]|uniref:Aldo/keto reductase n=1 Tax=Actinomadura logoneensis TaxID=2293572 RepID=A0A372JKQ7_9ACTN|nr:aldo/keto reductase [Actinomadura logoneensis]RFU40499.1 aldo/keto reductase [Actinomadura logoneensis]